MNTFAIAKGVVRASYLPAFAAALHATVLAVIGMSDYPETPPMSVYAGVVDIVTETIKGTDR